MLQPDATVAEGPAITPAETDAVQRAGVSRVIFECFFMDEAVHFLIYSCLHRRHDLGGLVCI